MIRSTDEAVCNEFIYLFLTSDTVIEKLQQLAEQSVSTFPSLKPSDIGNLEIMIPSTNECAEIESLLKPLFEILLLTKSNQLGLPNFATLFYPPDVRRVIRL